MKNSAIVILSEIALALYPILIKAVPTDLSTQLVSRLLTFSVLGFTFASGSDIAGTWGSGASIFRSMMLGIVTLFHVTTSYYAFEQLPAGIAMSLFYTYPFFNLLGGALFYGETITILQLLMMIVAFIGVIMVAPEVREGFEGSEERSFNWKGLFAGLAAALSETIMYFAVKGAVRPNPYFSMIELYPSALIAMLGYLGLNRQSIDLRPSVWLPMILFNAIVGFTGYAMRFYAIPHLPTIVFSILSFIGVVASFVWGYLFVREVPTWLSLVGATLITGAVGLSGAPA